MEISLVPLPLVTDDFFTDDNQCDVKEWSMVAINTSGTFPWALIVKSEIRKFHGFLFENNI